MDKFMIHGGKVLKGEATISGGKNTVLPILAASLLSKGTCVIRNVPNLEDVKVMIALLRSLGAKVIADKNRLSVNCAGVSLVSIKPEIMKKMRASNLVLGPILARFKEVELIQPGGCSIGSRPMDLHLKAMTAMGALVIQNNENLFAFTKGLQGANIQLDFPSVGATENIMMAAALAEGETVLNNGAKEPEIIDLANFINSMGGRIKGAGTDQIIIQGVKRLGSTEYTVMPDRIETGTLLIGAAITGGTIFLTGAEEAYNGALIACLEQAGLRVCCNQEGIGIAPCGRLRAVNIRTMPYPQFPTDMQPQFMALMTLAKGTSYIEETLFENRLKHVAYLNQLGASIVIRENLAIVEGVSQLTGGKVSATDLRAGAALILAGLAGEGTTTIDHIHFIDRGYDSIEQKLTSLGASIIRKSAKNSYLKEQPEMKNTYLATL